ncbi:uncharacterized protein SEPMUDRAFT_150569 [Sphaerulina musiva SO2202]|uniref:Uncharacterized protein n=1 Tax=Sphaerulina musiva (strain SO2202) TaxID=692275 RepID=N1QDZ6_SPHMS|nr:uncharacterized protein SEPMUDRAFT_150569 [Sphaerulina musiva SO2202]EMF10471.1 hypothetical protein SEPMUDRAFT_150569 [Sphaerulina musiva SO2202]
MREMSGLNARPRQRVLPTFASRGTQTPPPRRAQPAGPPAGPSAGPSSGPPGAAAPGAAHASAPLSDEAKRIKDLESANADLYERATELELNNGELVDELAALKERLTKQEKELTSRTKFAEASLDHSMKALSSESLQLSKTRADLLQIQGFNNELKTTLQKTRLELTASKDRTARLSHERDDVRTSFSSAQQEIDTLKKQIEQIEQGHNGRDAHEFLQAINEELEDQFTDAGTEFTPENVIAHIRRVSQQAAINREVSADSSSSQHNDPARRGLGLRTRSMAQELAEAAQDDGSDDEQGPDSLEPRKQRSSDDSNKLQQDHIAEVASLKMQIANLETQIPITNATHTTEVTTLQAKIEKLQMALRRATAAVNDEVDQMAELHETIENHEKTIENHEKTIENLEKQLSAAAAAHKTEVASLDRKTIENLEKQLGAAAAAHKTEVASLHDRIFDLSKMLFDLGEDNNALRRHFRPESAIITENEELHKKLKDVIAHLKDQIGIKSRLQDYEMPDYLQIVSEVLERDAAAAAKVPVETRNSASQTEEEPVNPTEIIKYVDKVRDATMFESFRQSPSWLQWLLTICVLFLLYFGVSGYQTDNMWLAANSTPALHRLRYTQADRAILGNFWSWLESVAGYDSQRFG